MTNNFHHAPSNSRTGLLWPVPSPPPPAGAPAKTTPASQVISFFRVRKNKQRVSIGLFVGLVVLCTVVFSSTPLVPVNAYTHLQDTQRSFLSSASPRRPTFVKQPSTQLVLTPTEELAAVSGYLAGISDDSIPAWVDPSVPIDPQLVLNFDTQSARAPAELVKLVGDVWQDYPVILYGKRYSPITREIKQMLLDLRVHPSATVFDVDTRDDGEVVAPLILRLTGANELPVLIVGGKIIGGITEVRELDASGELKRMVLAAGATPLVSVNAKGMK